MKKLVSLFLLVIIVAGSFFPNMDTCELSKIPQLIKHYKEHVEFKKESISFVDFILLHYGSGEESDEHRGQEDHGSLPFQDHAFHAMAAALTELNSFSFYTNSELLPILNSEYLYCEYSEYSFSLLQPPRL